MEDTYSDFHDLRFPTNRPSHDPNLILLGGISGMVDVAAMQEQPLHVTCAAPT